MALSLEASIVVPVSLLLLCQSVIPLGVQLQQHRAEAVCLLKLAQLAVNPAQIYATQEQNVAGKVHKITLSSPQRLLTALSLANDLLHLGQEAEVAVELPQLPFPALPQLP